MAKSKAPAKATESKATGSKVKVPKATKSSAKVSKATTSKAKSSTAKLSKAKSSNATTSKAKSSQVKKSKAKTSKILEEPIPDDDHFEAWNEDRTLSGPVIAKPPVRIVDYQLHDGDKWVRHELAEATPEPIVRKAPVPVVKTTKKAGSSEDEESRQLAAKGKRQKRRRGNEEADQDEEEAEAESDLDDVEPGWKRFTIPPASAREVMCVDSPSEKCLQCGRRGTAKSKCAERCYQKFRKQMLGETVIEIKKGAFGYGAFTKPDAKTIKKNSYLDEYIGELRPATVSQGSRYFCAIEGVCQIDAGEYGNWTRFINSSCDPNLKAITGYAGKKKFVVFVAIEKIAPGTELTFHYGSNYFGPFGIRCSCGATPDPHSPFEVERPEPGRKRKSVHAESAKGGAESSRAPKKAVKENKSNVAVKSAKSTSRPTRPKEVQRVEEDEIVVAPPKKRGGPETNA